MNQLVFTIPVIGKYHCDEKNKELKAIAESIEAVYVNARINGVNINRPRAYFAACEVCTIWYAVDTGVEHNDWKSRLRFPQPNSRAEELSIEVSGGFKSRKQAIRDLGDVVDIDAELAQVQFEEGMEADNTAKQDVFARAK